MRSILALALAVLVAGGCGGDDGGGGDGDPTFPAAGGTYNVTGGFDAVPSATITGTVVLVQPSRDVGTLSGTLDITGNINGGVAHVAGPLASASVTASNAVTFVYTDPSGLWSFSGTLSGTTVSGRHTLDVGDRFSGNFSMARVAAARTSPPLPEARVSTLSSLLRQ